MGCYPFDPGLEEVAKAVRNALIPSAHGRWERCFDEASHCCSHYMGVEVTEEETSGQYLHTYTYFGNECKHS